MSTIGIIGDTHDLVVGRATVRGTLGPVLHDVAMILHTGDVSTAEMLDDLERIAPVLAVRSESDPDLPPRLTDGPRRIDIEGCRIELVRSLDPDARVERDDVDLVVHGGTHAGSFAVAGRTIYVDPGAPVLTPRPSGARVELTDGRINVTFVQL